MKWKLRKDLLLKNSLTEEEFLLLYILSKDIRIKDLIESLTNKNFIHPDLFDSNGGVVSNQVKNLVNSIIINSYSDIASKEDIFTQLAVAMQNCYPSGRKAGTTYSWRGSTKIIADRIKKVAVKFKTEFTVEEVTIVTKHFVNGFTDKTYMPLLQYFICKEDMNKNFISRFMEEIELYRENKEKYDNEKNNYESFGDLV